MRILVMGLSGSGKSYLSERLQKHLNCVWINADTIRKMTLDWDFSYEGRIRQAKRMKYYSDFELDFNKNVVICDFICAIEDMRTILKPDYVGILVIELTHIAPRHLLSKNFDFVRVNPLLKGFRELVE